MKMLRTASCALFLFGLVAAPPAQAQTPWELGPQLGVNLDNNELNLGAMARIHLSSLPITLNPGLEFYPGNRQHARRAESTLVGPEFRRAVPVGG
jgi:hypothetical protein